MADDVKSKIADLEKELYSKDFKALQVEESLKPKEARATPSWDIASDERLFLDARKRQHRTMKKFVFISIMFFIFAAGVAGFVWYRGTNIISSENIIIDISAPITINGGEPFETRFTVTNNNKVPIESAKLFIEYPSGFYSALDNSELPRAAVELGAIGAGQSVVKSIGALLYGEENTNKEPMVTLEYRTTGSNAILKKTESFLLRIASSPVSLVLRVPKEASSGQEIDIIADIVSNSRDPISNLLVSVVYPTGFSFINSDTSSLYGNDTWGISVLEPQEKRTIKIHGVIEGQENEEKTSRLSVGTPSTKDERFIGVTYNSVIESIVITRPVLGIEVSANGSYLPDTVVPLNRGVSVDAYWKNNNKTKISDVVIEVKLKGTAIDRYTVYASGGGFYQSVDDTIIWNKIGDKRFETLDPGESGSVSFSFSPVALGLDAERLIKNPQIIFEVRARAERVSETSAQEQVATFVKHSVKFETDLRLIARGYFFTGPFENIGPLPPQPNIETTYTISMTARNSSNSVSNTTVRTSLPLYVKWMNKVYPDGEGITYNANTHEVVWNAGRIISGGSRDASFQVSLLPSISQINSAPFLTGDFTLTGTDDYTKTEVSDKISAITTALSSDGEFMPNYSNVVQ